jgi:ABC-2 type transport system permease protein
MRRRQLQTDRLLPDVRGTWVIYRRELGGLFLQPIAWVLLALALFLNGFFFELYLRAAKGDADLAFSYLYGTGFSWWILTLVLPPLVTMRMISEEARSGMLEFLLTAPVRDSALVLGKLLAATTFMAVLWASVFVYALALSSCGAVIDWPRLGLAWCGTVLGSGLFCAAGLLASALSSTPIVAAFLGMMLNAAILFLPRLVVQLGFLPRATRSELAARVNVVEQIHDSFLRGLFDSATLVFLLVWTALLLVLCTRRVEMQRWNA